VIDVRRTNKDKFINKFEKKVKETIKRYKLLSKKHRVIVGVSGGKDSSTVLHILNKLGYKPEALHVYMGGEYFDKSRIFVRKLCRNEGATLHEINMKQILGFSHSDIVKLIRTRSLKLNICYICGVLRRYLINKAAQELKADRIVVGHNLDDEAETIMMNILKGDLELCLNLGPKTGVVESRLFVQRVKPLYFCTNEETKKYSKLLNLPVLYKKCPYLVDSFRLHVREFLKDLEKINSDVKYNIVKNFLILLPKLRKKLYKGEEIKTCSICGQASRSEVCRTCKIIELLKSNDCGR
jgi:uncharacterized protein (TIGR00269 family)